MVCFQPPRYPKGQITGILVLLFLLLLVFLLIVALVPKSTTSDDDLVLYSQTAAQFDTLVQSCFSKAAKEGLLLLGRQGGVLYHYQAAGLPLPLRLTNPFGFPLQGYEYGSYVVPVQISGQIYNVTIAIRRQTVQQGTFYPLPPFYPEINTSVKNIYDFPPAFGFIFPTSMYTKPHLLGYLYPLCDQFGTNPPLHPLELEFCETYHSAFTLERMLRIYVQNKTITCLNPTTLSDLFPEYNITLGTPQTNVRITHDSVFFTLNLPASLSSPQTKVNLTTATHVVKHDVRLKQIHELATHLVRKEITHLHFHLLENASTLIDCLSPRTRTKLPLLVQCHKPGMHVSQVRFPCIALGDPYRSECAQAQAAYTYVVNITDEKSLIDGTPYGFYFGIHNRYPVLDYIHLTAGISLSNLYDIIVVAGDTITIDPYGYDPDMDVGFNGSFDGYNRWYLNRTYNYSGWKATYDQKNKITTGYLLTDVLYLGEQMVTLHQEQLNCAYPYDSCQQSWGYFVRSSPILYENQWQASLSYLETKRKATYQTNLTDVGPHVVRVSVCDEGGLCDYQDVKILVLNATEVRNNFTWDNPEDYAKASREDPLIFQLLPIPSRLQEAKWEYLVSNSQAKELAKAYPHDFRASLVPNSIRDLLSVPYVLATIEPNAPPVQGGDGKRRTTYTFDDGSITSTSGNLPLYQCLPAYKQKDAATGRTLRSPYPYFGFAGDNYDETGIPDIDDPYKGSHLCCRNDTAEHWGTYESPFTVCYDLQYYTCNPLVYLLSSVNDASKQAYYAFLETQFATFANPGQQLSYASFHPTNALLTFLSGRYFPIPPLNLTVKEDTVSQAPRNLVPYPASQLFFSYQPGPLNAIYQRTFTQSCGGGRGNACAGDASADTWTEVKDVQGLSYCQNENSHPGERGSCKAPAAFISISGDALAQECKDAYALNLDLSSSSLCTPLSVPFETMLGLYPDAFCNVNPRCAAFDYKIVTDYQTGAIGYEITPGSVTFAQPYVGRCKNLKCNPIDGSCTKADDDVECTPCIADQSAVSYSATTSGTNRIWFSAPGCLSASSQSPEDTCSGTLTTYDVDINEFLCHNPLASNNPLAIQPHLNMVSAFYNPGALFSLPTTSSAWIPSAERTLFHGGYATQLPSTLDNNDIEDQVVFMFNTPQAGYQPALSSSSSYQVFDCCGDDDNEHPILLSAQGKSCRQLLLGQSSPNFAFCCNNPNKKINDFALLDIPGNVPVPYAPGMYCVSECWYLASPSSVILQSESTTSNKRLFINFAGQNQLVREGNADLSQYRVRFFAGTTCLNPIEYTASIDSTLSRFGSSTQNRLVLNLGNSQPQRNLCRLFVEKLNGNNYEMVYVLDLASNPIPIT